jgi:hypothetical protein
MTRWRVKWSKIHCHIPRLAANQSKMTGKDCPVFFFRALHLRTGMAGGLLMPVCDLPDRLGQGVDNDGGSAVAKALDGEVVGLVRVFGGVPKSDDDAIVWKVRPDTLTDGAGLREGEGRQG